LAAGAVTPLEAVALRAVYETAAAVWIRPPPFHAASAATGGNRRQLFASSQAGFGVAPFAVGCRGLRPLCSTNAPWFVCSADDDGPRPSVAEPEGEDADDCVGATAQDRQSGLPIWVALPMCRRRSPS